jgi:hypothetical protein
MFGHALLRALDVPGSGQSGLQDVRGARREEERNRWNVKFC